MSGRPWFERAESVAMIAGILDYAGLQPFFAGLGASLLAQFVMTRKGISFSPGVGFKPILTGGASYVGAILATRLIPDSGFSEPLGVFLGSWAAEYESFGKFEH